MFALHLVRLEAGLHDVRPAGHEVDVDLQLRQQSDDLDATARLAERGGGHHAVDLEAVNQLHDVGVAAQHRHKVQQAVVACRGAEARPRPLHAGHHVDAPFVVAQDLLQNRGRLIPGVR
jgi:hypothetical protein